jgi:hypothetical protein
MRARHSRQLDLPTPPTWGGRRLGAGRRPGPGRPRVPHRRRPDHRAAFPAHLTIRARADLPSLRATGAFAALRRSIAAASGPEFRVIHFSVQADHLHAIVEAEGRTSLSRGAAGLAIRAARAINRALGRRGAVWADRYHARAMRTPRETRNGILYVLQNWKKHVRGAHGIDGRSSGPWFDGWSKPVRPPPNPSPVVNPRTWLAARGWRRAPPSLLSPDDGPAALRPRAGQVKTTGRSQIARTTHPSALVGLPWERAGRRCPTDLL